MVSVELLQKVRKTFRMSNVILIWSSVGLLLNCGMCLSEVPYSAIISDCSQHPCLTVYQHDSYIPWADAVSVCAANNQSLVIINNQAVQDRVYSLIIEANSMGTERVIAAWVAGRQQDDEVWRYEDTTVVDGLLLQELNATTSGMNCAFMNLQSVEVAADKCTEIREGHRTVCQTLSPEQADCQAGADDVAIYVWYSGLCYIILGSYHNWYEARMACLVRRAELIKNNLDNNTFIELLSNNLHNTDTNKTMWLGITRYPWVWYIDMDSTFAMSYYNWPRLDPPVTDSAGNYCLYVTFTGVWTSSPCSRNTSRVLVCSEPVRPPTRPVSISSVAITVTPDTPTSSTTMISTPVLRTTLSSTPATSPVSSADTPTTSTPHSAPTTASQQTAGNTLPLEYIIPGVIGGVLIIVIPVTVCLLLRRRRRKMQPPSSTITICHDYENQQMADNFNLTANGNSSLTSQQSNHVNHLIGSEASPYETITPYEVIGPYDEDTHEYTACTSTSSENINPYLVHNPAVMSARDREEHEIP